MEIGYIVFIALVIFFLSSMIKVASENERFAAFKFGRYMGLKGPGLVIKSPGSENKWVKLSVGDRGELVAPGVGSFKDIQVPVQIDENVKVDTAIRIIGFDSAVIRTMADPDQSRKILCEKCGHEMTI